jgi:hypothetical protein
VAPEALQGPLPEPPTRDELLRILGVAARAGHVPAIRLLLDELRLDVKKRTKPGSWVRRTGRGACPQARRTMTLI